MLSDIEPVATEARNNERFKVDKPTTTVGLDYGEILLGDAGKVALYGIPGQERFDFMWPIVAKGAMGVILLLDCSQDNYIEKLASFADTFSKWVDPGSFVVALNRGTENDLEACNLLVEKRDVVMPVFMADPREKDDLNMLLHVLISNAEIRLLQE
ncbi:MAG: GTP-binding protein [Oceanospirillales bacterium]|nr:GTP-binding protein [Oceanospirillales bacterium]